MTRRVARDVCRDFARASRIEWVEANGAGSFAMGTAAGVATRRYHGLLVASARPPGERAMALARVEDEVEVGGARQALATNQYPGAVHPRGHLALASFALAPHPTWRFEVGGAAVERSVFLPEGEPAAIVTWRADRAARVTAAPLVALRDYHALLRAGDGARPEVTTWREGSVARAVVRREGRALHLFASAEECDPGGDWFYANEYLVELERGFPFREDLFRPLTLRFVLSPERPAWLAATLDPEARFDDARVLALEAARRARGDRHPMDLFCARRHDGAPTLLAGYPWFTDWGRDTMIALPGLLAEGFAHDHARAILEGFLAHLDRGLVPNRFPDVGERPEYNTADATLWLFVAARAYLEASGDRAFLRDVLFPRVQEILAWHERGTHHGIGVDAEDGLLVAGGPGTQLTWMDAKVGDRVATPRHGKPVEVNALWFNALRIAEAWARALGDAGEASRFASRAAKVERSFAAFWNEARGCLFDVLRPEGADPALRPNQLFAVSLPYPLLDPPRRGAVLDRVREHLLTPYGLRTLAPGEPGYVGRYEGGPEARDLAYHQGTVWPWLLGAYVDACFAVHGRTPEVRASCRALLDPLLATMDRVCLGSIAEIFDGDAPHAPRGCPAQAWSVAEVLRAKRACEGA